MGRYEDLCEALSKGVMGIGASMGRSEATGDKFDSYNAAKKLHEQFLRAFDSSLCKELNYGDFKSREHSSRCKNFTLDMVRMTYRILRKV